MANNTSKKTNSKTTSKKASTSLKKSSTPSYQKKAVKTVKKVAKKNPKAFIIILIIVALVAAAGFAVWYFLLRDKSEAPKSNDPHIAEAYSPKVEGEGISINFIELDNHNTGDATYIKAGDNDILIDAGSIQSSARTIKKFVNQFCTDGKLEYVIATHAHKDHIAGFVGTKDEPGIFESYKIGTLIDFALTNSESQLYKNYSSIRDAALESGDIEHHYTAAECIKGENGAQKEYTLASNITMTVLDQKYYYEKSSDENNYSVCVLFNQITNHYLFTGDLEKEGEESLVELNELTHCQLFKAGHHGSKTSNTETLLSKITPDVVCVCCCAGNDEYTKNVENQFPTQQTIDNVAKYTSTIFVTTVTTDGKSGHKPMNGNINFKCGSDLFYWISGDNNSLILKDTDWFKENRTWPEGGK